MLLLAVVGAAGITAQMLAAPPSPDSAATVPTASPAANVAGASNAAGASSSVRTHYVYGDQLRPMVEETGGVQTLSIYGPGGQIIAQVVQNGLGGQEVRYLLADHLGSTRVVLDADGNVVARFEYGPYGETTAAGTAAAEVRYRYTGHPYDEAQGVYETPARGYNPTLGRFLSVDPQRQDASPYVYGGNNPLGFLDTTGGGLVPFFVVSGMEVNDRGVGGSLSQSIAELFGAHRNQQLASSDIFNRRSRVWPSEAIRFPRQVPERSLPEVDGQSTHYNEMLYWVIGEGAAVPNELVEGMVVLQGELPIFARNIVLLDFAGDGQSAQIAHELARLDRRRRIITIFDPTEARRRIDTTVIRAEIVSDADVALNRHARGFMSVGS